MTSSTISQLPDAVVVIIFQHLDIIYLVNASKVCRRWYRISLDSSLTKSFDLRACPMFLTQLWKVSYRKLQETTNLVQIRGRLDRSKSMVELSKSYLLDLFSRCKNIKNLALERFDLRAIPLDILPESLEVLSLRESMLTMGCFDLLKQRTFLPNLKCLDLNSCTKISNNDLEALSYLKHLEKLVFCQCYRISARGIPTITANMKRLKYVDFTGCPGINNVVMYHLSPLHLEHLLVRFCHLITDAGIKELLKETGNVHKTLKYLDLFSCHELTNASLDTIVLNTKVLKSLDISACKKLTVKKIEEIREELPNAIVNFEIVTKHS